MFSAKQFPFTGQQSMVSPFTPLETQLAAFQDLSQLLSEDIDRYTETCNHIWQNLSESIWQQQLDLFSGKPSDELLMNLSARLQALFEQSSQAQLSLHSIVDDAMRKATDLFSQSWQFPQQMSISMPFTELNFTQFTTNAFEPKTKDITPTVTKSTAEKTTEKTKTARTVKKAISKPSPRRTSKAVLN